MRMIDGTLYLNTGDWVESCTALVEHHDGRLELVDWGGIEPVVLLRAQTGQGGATCLKVFRLGGFCPNSRVLIVSDAWLPQVNGVVRTLATLVHELQAMGVVAEVVGPDRFRTLPCPTYPDIRLSVLPRRRLAKIMTQFRPDALHIATEGPLGVAARALARRRGWIFTTAFHTRFPRVFARARTLLPTAPDLCVAAGGFTMRAMA